MSNPELLPDGKNYVDEEGDVRFINRSAMEPMDLTPDHDYGQSPDKVGFKDGRSSSEEATRTGVSVNLIERSVLLSRALDAFLQSSRANGFARASEYDVELQSRYSPMESDRIIESEAWRRDTGNAQFFRAFGGHALIKAGYDARAVEYGAREEAKSFAIVHTGPDNKKRRYELRKILKRQIK